MAQFINFGSGREGSLNISSADLGGIAGFGVATVTGTAGQSSCVKVDKAYFNGGNGGRDGDMVFINQSQGIQAGQWEVNYIVSTAGTTVNLLYPLSYTYTTGAQMYTSPQLYNGTISGTLGSGNWGGEVGGIVFLVDKGTLTISGSINANGAGFRGGVGSPSNTTPAQGYTGEGFSSGSLQQNAANIVGGGGGTKGGLDGAGGGAGGGYGAVGGAGENRQGTGGVAGEAAGLANLSVMIFGGGGGGGSVGAGQTTPGATGGAGGGIIMIIAKNIIVSGSISANGANGATGPHGGDATGSGGGAGGSVLIKTQSGVLGTSLVTASGGSKGLAFDQNNQYRICGDGGNGGVGRIHINYLTSYTGTTTPTIDAVQDTSLKSQVYSGMI